MAISKNGILYCTNEQIEQAKGCSALDYAQAHGYDLVHQGGRYVLWQHNSMVFFPDGRWFWNSRGYRGRALDLLMYYEELPFVAAVLRLAGDTAIKKHGAGMQHTAAPAEKADFLLPERSPTQKHLFAYLCGVRKLSPDIVRTLVHDKRLYEGVHRYRDQKCGQERASYNAVFLGLDEGGRPRSAFQRGLSSKSTFKCEVPGSEKLEHPFCLPGHPDASCVGFFEASIDAIAHATLHGHRYRNMERVAMGGIIPEAAVRYLARHREKRSIHLCLDADSAGAIGAAKIESALREHGFDEPHGYQFIHEQVPEGKDWDAYLINKFGGKNHD